MTNENMTDIAVLLFHVLASFSGWALLFVNRRILEKTSSKFFNLSSSYLKYATISATSASSAMFVLIQGSELAASWFGFQIGGISWLWKFQAVGSAVSFCLVHLYFFRVLGGTSAGKTPSS